MVFSDSIKVKTYCKEADVENNIDDIIEVSEWVELGKCTILPNADAKKQQNADSEQRTYSYEVVMRMPKSYIPRENDWVWLQKKDGTIDEELQVIGFLTIKGRYLKLWV